MKSYRIGSNNNSQKPIFKRANEFVRSECTPDKHSLSTDIEFISPANNFIHKENSKLDQENLSEFENSKLNTKSLFQCDSYKNIVNKQKFDTKLHKRGCSDGILSHNHPPQDSDDLTDLRYEVIDLINLAKDLIFDENFKKRIKYKREQAQKFYVNIIDPTKVKISDNLHLNVVSDYLENTRQKDESGAIESLISQSESNLKDYLQQQFINGHSKKNIACENDKLFNLNYIKRVKDLTVMDCKEKYKETLMDERSLKFKSVKTIGKLKNKRTFVVQNQCKKQEKLDVDPYDRKKKITVKDVEIKWQKNLRTKFTKDTPVKTSTCYKEIQSFLEESKIRNKEKQLKNYLQKQELIKNFPKRQRKPKFDQDPVVYGQDFDKKISTYDEQINQKIIILLQIMSQKGLSEKDFFKNINKHLKIFVQSDENYEDLFQKNIDYYNKIRNCTDHIYEKFYKTSKHEELLKKLILLKKNKENLYSLKKSERHDILNLGKNDDSKPKILNSFSGQGALMAANMKKKFKHHRRAKSTADKIMMFGTEKQDTINESDNENINATMILKSSGNLENCFNPKSSKEVSLQVIEDPNVVQQQVPQKNPESFLEKKYQEEEAKYISNLFDPENRLQSIYKDYEFSPYTKNWIRSSIEVKNYFNKKKEPIYKKFGLQPSISECNSVSNFDEAEKKQQTSTKLNTLGQFLSQASKTNFNQQNPKSETSINTKNKYPNYQPQASTKSIIARCSVLFSSPKFLDQMCNIRKESKDTGDHKSHGSHDYSSSDCDSHLSVYDIDEIDLQDMKQNAMTKSLVDSLMLSTGLKFKTVKKSLGKSGLNEFFKKCSKFQDDFEDLYSHIRAELLHEKANWQKFMMAMENKFIPSGLENFKKILKWFSFSQKKEFDDQIYKRNLKYYAKRTENIRKDIQNMLETLTDNNLNIKSIDLKPLIILPDNKKSEINSQNTTKNPLNLFNSRVRSARVEPKNLSLTSLASQNSMSNLTNGKLQFNKNVRNKVFSFSQTEKPNNLSEFLNK